jgi:hypothetical protein
MIMLFKSLFLLCILLLSGYFQSTVYAFHESNNIASVKNINGFFCRKNQNMVLKSSFSHSKEQKNQITDIEEKELSSFKLFTVFGSGVKNPFYAQILGIIFHCTRLQLCFFDYLSYYPSCKSRYLLFEVMRI